MDMLNADEIKGKAVMCRCWRSGTFPACDGSHVAHNKETGDNVGPLIINAPAKESVAMFSASGEQQGVPGAGARRLGQAEGFADAACQILG